jgi:carbonic anhydrase/acetyltransferase-like protein (isoleucine patch superfamily)
MFILLPFMMLILIWSGSLAIALLPLSLALTQANPWLIVAGFGLFPLLFVPSFITLAGVLSRCAQSRIIAGRYQWAESPGVFGARRIYGICWTQVFMAKPLYAICLALPFLKSYMLRLFGYQGPSRAFHLGLDTWLRDLPLLKMGRNAGLGNGSVIGTNMSVNENTIIVDGIQIGEQGQVGPLVVLAPGCRVENGADVGAQSVLGLRTWVGPTVVIEPNCMLHHGCVLEEGCEIGTRSCLGLSVRVGKGVKVPAGTHLPQGAVMMNQADMDRYSRLETIDLQKFAAQLDAIR